MNTKNWRRKHNKCAVSGLTPEEKRLKLNAYFKERHQALRQNLTEAQKEEAARKRREYNARYYEKNKAKIIDGQRKHRQAKRETPEQAAERKRKAVEASLKYKAKVREEKRAARQWEKQAQANRKREESRRYKTKAVDTSQLIPVRIDHKTVIYARPGQNIEELKQRYKRTA
jgi:hypothetical protein